MIKFKVFMLFYVVVSCVAITVRGELTGDPLYQALFLVLSASEILKQAPRLLGRL